MSTSDSSFRTLFLIIDFLKLYSDIFKKIYSKIFKKLLIDFQCLGVDIPTLTGRALHDITKMMIAGETEVKL